MEVTGRYAFFHDTDTAKSLDKAKSDISGMNPPSPKNK